MIVLDFSGNQILSMDDEDEEFRGIKSLRILFFAIRVLNPNSFANLGKLFLFGFKFELNR